MESERRHDCIGRWQRRAEKVSTDQRDPPAETPPREREHLGVRVEPDELCLRRCAQAAACQGPGSNPEVDDGAGARLYGSRGGLDHVPLTGARTADTLGCVVNCY